MRPPLGKRNPFRDSNLHQDATVVSPHIPTDTCRNDPDLTAVIESWDRLPEAIKAGMMAMVRTASGK